MSKGGHIVVEKSTNAMDGVYRYLDDAFRAQKSLTKRYKNSEWTVRAFGRDNEEIVLSKFPPDSHFHSIEPMQSKLRALSK